MSKGKVIFTSGLKSVQSSLLCAGLHTRKDLGPWEGDPFVKIYFNRLKQQDSLVSGYLANLLLRRCLCPIFGEGLGSFVTLAGIRGQR